MRLLDGRQPAFDLGKGLVPGRLDQAAVAPDQRRAQAVGVFVQVLQRRALGADAPRMPTMRSPCVRTSSPQQASHNGQMR